MAKQNETVVQNENTLTELVVTFRSKKAKRELEVDLMKLPRASLMAVAQYGATRYINDKLGGSEITPEQAAKDFEAIIQKLEKGDVGRRQAEALDPVETKAISLARDLVKGKIMAAGHKLKDVKKENLDNMVKDVYEKQKAAFRKQAEEVIAAEKAAKEQAAGLGDVDLSDLGL